MINLEEVANKLQKIFNGTDTETADILKPTNFQFMVASQGYHLDSIADMKTGKNFIPVFISSLGGTIQPIPNLLKSSYNISVTMYFPVRFKEDFYNLTDFIAEVFSGKVYEFGKYTGKCVTNLSIPQYGEIEDIDLDNFRLWIDNCYKKKISSMEAWMSMTFELYLSTAKNFGKADGPIYGNEVKISLSYTWAGVEHTDDSPLFASTDITSNGEPTAQQVLGQKETSGLVVNTSYAVPLNLIIKRNEFYRQLLELYLSGSWQNLSLNIKIDIPSFGLSYIRKCYGSNTTLDMPKGDLISLGLTLSKKLEVI